MGGKTKPIYKNDRPQETSQTGTNPGDSQTTGAVDFVASSTPVLIRASIAAVTKVPHGGVYLTSWLPKTAAKPVPHRVNWVKGDIGILSYLIKTSAHCSMLADPILSSELPVTMSKYAEMALYRRPPTPACMSGLACNGGLKRLWSRRQEHGRMPSVQRDRYDQSQSGGRTETQRIANSPGAQAIYAKPKKMHFSTTSQARTSTYPQQGTAVSNSKTNKPQGAPENRDPTQAHLHLGSTLKSFEHLPCLLAACPRLSTQAARVCPVLHRVFA